MKRINKIVGAVAMALALVSCSDMLETDSTRQVFEPELSQKTDSVYYALGILQGMQQLADQYVYQGELRGDLVRVTEYTDKNLQQLANFTATTENKYDSAYVYYRVINNCNYYIAHRDTTLRRGATAVSMPEYIGIKAIRAWAYLQLARTYGEVPFFLEPLTQISQIDNNNFPVIGLREIVDRLTPDLEQYSGLSTPDYGSAPQNSNFTSKKVFIPVDVILGDLYLETNQYEKAAQHYITYLTEVTTVRTSQYSYFFTGGRRGIYNYDQLPGNWDVSANNTLRYVDLWSNIFASTPDGETITYIPFNANSRQGAITSLPLAFGYDYYSNESGYVQEVQLEPSEAYLELVDNQDYYYVTNATTTSYAEFGAVKLGDVRYTSILHSENQGDSVKTWINKYRYPDVKLYRVSTVLLRLAEAFNRIGMYDVAFAILKDGISDRLVQADYISPASLNSLQTVYPMLSSGNIQLFTFASTIPSVGIHSHGSGYTYDFYNSIYQPGLSPYKMTTVVGNKLDEIASKFSVAVGQTPQDSINAVEDLICDEYALELAFEGGRFFDLCRLARHKNADSTYGGNFGGRWLARKLSFKGVAGLENESSWYLPFK